MYNELAPSFHAMKTGGILCKHQPDRSPGWNADLHVTYPVTTNTCQEGL